MVKYSGKDVAKYMLQYCKKCNNPISNLKMQKDN